MYTLKNIESKVYDLLEKDNRLTITNMAKTLDLKKFRIERAVNALENKGIVRQHKGMVLLNKKF